MHIGAHKTGSTSIQQAFFNSASALRRRGISYFPYDSNHTLPFTWLFANDPANHHFTLRARLSPQALEHRTREIDNCLKEFLADQNSQIKIISGEGISCLAELEVDRVRKYFDAAANHQIKIIIYLRNLYEFIDSAAQELVKSGYVLEQVEAAILAGEPMVRPGYEDRTRKFQRVFGLENVIIKVFDTERFKDGDVVADFCETIGAPELYGELPKIRANESISHEAVRLLSRYDQLFPIMSAGEFNPSRSDKLHSYLPPTSGAKFRITKPELLDAYDRLIATDKVFIKAAGKKTNHKKNTEQDEHKKNYPVVFTDRQGQIIFPEVNNTV